MSNQQPAVLPDLSARSERKTKSSQRLASIDVFRAITMFLMVFVNDLWTDLEVPAWLEHAPAQADALGFSDIIFPAFLFIVGLSIPLSQKSRLAAGASKSIIFQHILLRSLALILMGFFHVNSENYSNDALLPKPVWVIFTTTAFFLLWLDYPKKKEKEKLWLQLTGVALLIAMAALYQGEGAGGTVWMSKQWWGILGLIGWAYFSCATIFLLVNERIGWLIASFFFFVFFNASVRLHEPEFMQTVSAITGKLVGGNGSNASIVIMGVLSSVLYTRLINKPRQLSVVLLAIAACLFAFGFATRPLWEISKIRATPSWTTICMGISIVSFLAFIFLIDRAGKQDWFKMIRPAGTSTLTCYLLPYFYYSIFISLLGIRLPAFLRTGAVGIGKSLLFALLIVLLTGVLEKRKLRLKL